MGQIIHRTDRAAEIRPLAAHGLDSFRGLGLTWSWLRPPTAGPPPSHPRLPLSPAATPAGFFPSFPSWRKMTTLPTLLPGKLSIRSFKGSELLFAIPYIKHVLTIFWRHIPSPKSLPIHSPHSPLFLSWAQHPSLSLTCSGPSRWAGLT